MPSQTFLLGVLKGKNSGNKRLPGIPWWLWLLLILPMAFGGFTQMFGLRESTWELRVLTGTLFGLTSIGFTLPFSRKRSKNHCQLTLEYRSASDFFHVSEKRLRSVVFPNPGNEPGNSATIVVGTINDWRKDSAIEMAVVLGTSMNDRFLGKGVGCGKSN